MNCDNLKTLRKRFLRVMVVLLCFIVAGPELGLGFELVAVLDALGLELFVLAFTAPLWVYWYRAKSFLERIDPYFFIASRSQLKECPALFSHAIPFFVLFMVEGIVISTLGQSFTDAAGT